MNAIEFAFEAPLNVPVTQWKQRMSQSNLFEQQAGAAATAAPPGKVEAKPAPTADH
jgi:hypothetical protein